MTTSEQQRAALQDKSSHYRPESIQSKSSLVIWIVSSLFLVLFIWAYFFSLEEVSTGTGKVVPSSKDQVIQSLDGGVVTKLNVKEGDIVEKGQILAQIDPTRFESQVGESKSKLLATQ